MYGRPPVKRDVKSQAKYYNNCDVVKSGPLLGLQILKIQHEHWVKNTGPMEDKVWSISIKYQELIIYYFLDHDPCNSYPFSSRPSCNHSRNPYTASFLLNVCM